MTSPRAVLIVVGGLPGAGKTTVATAYVCATGAAFVRIDTIEQALVDRTALTRPLGPAGYEIGHALAGEQLRLGVDVEITCPDPGEHRRRVETRVSDVPGLVLPTWSEVVARRYEPWHTDRLVLDTARCSPERAADAVADAVRRAR